MADVSELTKLNREQLNEFAQANGVSDAADESKYVTKKDLAEAVAPNVTPEALEAFKSGEPAPAESDSVVHNGQDAADSPANPPVDDEPKSDEQEQVEQNIEDADKAFGTDNQPADGPVESTPPAPAETLPTPPIDSPEDVNDDSGVEAAPGAEDDDEEEADDEPEPTPTRRGSRQDDSEEGMGFPRKDGKTLSIFSKKPHETVRNVGGVMVPLTNEEAVGNAQKNVLPKSDAEIIAKLRKLGKM